MNDRDIENDFDDIICAGAEDGYNVWSDIAQSLSLCSRAPGNNKDRDSATKPIIDALAAIGSAAVKTATDVAYPLFNLPVIDKIRELDSKPKGDAKKQEWVVAMYIATDFGNECTIEKRTKKLQELAAQTADKPVTIIVQTANKDKAGKYQIERFALKDGKVLKLESPGETKGYAQDVEDLLSYTTKNHQSKNLALTLDSHGSGNSGLHGDVGDLSLVNLSKAVKNGLKGSGHEKLDLLQFDACLMAQNGVLESTTGITRHVVASAEPEGTGADAANADNRQLLELLKKPTMTAGELADIFVAQSKDNADFKTLAHFDLKRYESFRKSLDLFGEKLAKLCEDPENLKVIRAIIKDTFSYGKFSFGLIPSIGVPGLGGIRPLLNQMGPGKFNDTSRRRIGPDALGPNLLRPDVLEPDDLSGLGIGGFFGLLNRDRNKRDLKDFVARILVAISKGQLKDEDGTLKRAGHSVLYEGTMLTKSFYGRDERKDLGGLSAFLPPEPGDGEPEVSTTGGWRKFQQHLRKDKK